MVHNKKILIIKHGSTGDIFMSFNVLKSIINHNPNITICSTKTGFKTLKLLNSNFKEITDDRGKFIETIKVLLKIKKKKFDYIIDLQNSTRSSTYLLFIKLFSNAKSNGTSKELIENKSAKCNRVFIFKIDLEFPQLSFFFFDLQPRIW